MTSHFGVAIFCLLSVSVVLADILVNVNVNKPVHDVSEQFVSFSIAPELLYGTLDGTNKKTLTDMAALLGPSFIKMTGDYFFPTDIKSTLKNPTQTIWSGFNRWTRAMNWTMVVPVQYTPQSWDPIDALRVLNISNIIGIDNCVWQLGLDFGASRASDYVADLQTLDTMVDTFRPYVKEWKVIGADITAGSSAEETKRYIDMSSDVNSAFGWNQPAGYHVEENVNGYIYDKDLSLKAMMEKKVPVWLSLPPKGLINHQTTNGYAGIEVSEAIRWAQTLGDAASSGFSAVFKPLTEEDVSSPTYGFFVSALFKKIMGNRVFAAKPVKRYTYSSKIYSHCANGISGGIAFMGVNTEDYAVKISAKPSAKFTGSEVWQFILTSKKGVMYLNNDILTLNSTFDPLVKIKHPNKPLAMNLPPMSVGFWVLPLANHEDCQFTELLTNQDTQWENRHRRQTSSDRLLKKLILETSFTDQMKNRRRRDTTNVLNKESAASNGNVVARQRRFILQETPGANPAPQKVSPQVAAQERNLKKRENVHQLLKSLVLNPLLTNPLIPSPLLPKVDWTASKRTRRAADFLSTMFPKSTLKASTRRQPAPKVEVQDEASIFKTTVAQMVMPEGDVHFDYITDSNGEEISTKESREEFAEEEKVPKLPNRELPSEFYEAIDHGKYIPRAFQYKPIVKPEVSDVSDISGQTKYITRNQLENQSQEEQVKNENTKTYKNDAGEQSTFSKLPFAPEFPMTPYPILRSADNARKFFYKPIESDALREYLSSVQPEWELTQRTKRSIGSGKYSYKTMKDNLINQNEYVEPLTYNNPQVSETILEESVLGAEARAAGENVKSKVSKILGVVKTHLSDFFSTFL
ncbi:uncharacterized protein LOC129916792 [Episyrphus balteatus]|uniref:uncharacterized protein LOC129916792 n=1 Tax=Episyrphus balteatus TaxID=286459 RepID=UPI0024867F66|nr:uncharacterized protein LOC129916792 [Episyrphus balteatus]